MSSIIFQYGFFYFSISDSKKQFTCFFIRPNHCCDRKVLFKFITNYFFIPPINPQIINKNNAISLANCQFC